MRAIERTQTVAKSQSRSENCGEVVANGTAYKLNPASWDGADHDRQRVDHTPSPRGFAPGAVSSPGAYQEYHTHLSRTHGDGFSEPFVWSSPTGRLGRRKQVNHRESRWFTCLRLTRNHTIIILG